MSNPRWPSLQKQNKVLKYEENGEKKNSQKLEKKFV